MAATDFGARNAARPNDALDLWDYERIMQILADCSCPRTVQGFREVVVESLSRHLGYRTATVFSGSTLSTLFCDPEPLRTGRAVNMFADYHKFWFQHDFFATAPSLRSLQTTRVASLGELRQRLSPGPRKFIEEFFEPGGLRAAVALHLQVSDHQQTLVGLFDSGDSVKEERNSRLLRRLAPPLNAISRSIPAPSAPDDADVIGRLTERQRQVALLIAEGLGNAAIAEMLVIREDTVKKYVSGILATLGCRSRTQVALLVTQRMTISVSSQRHKTALSCTGQ